MEKIIQETIRRENTESIRRFLHLNIVHILGITLLPIKEKMLEKYIINEYDR